MRRRDAPSGKPIADTYDNVIAIAADHPVQGNGLPVLDLNAPETIADFILEMLFTKEDEERPDAHSTLREC